MAVYTIIRVYEVPADSRYEATDRMLEALELHTHRAADWLIDRGSADRSPRVFVAGGSRDAIPEKGG